MSSKKKATAAKEKAKSVLVPKLRFPEFRGVEGWEPKTLAEICLLITNGKANAQDHEEEGCYPLFDRSAVIKKSSEFLFDGEAVILPGEGMRFAPKYFRGKFNLHQRAYALMRHQGDGRFVYHSLDFFQDALAEKAVKSTVLSLRLPIVENFVIGCPGLDEQQKIAECLSSLGELMAAQARKVDTLKTHKKGLMQHIFPRDCETQPRLRFPEFKNAGEWVVKPFGEIFHITSSKRVHESDWTSTGVPFYRAREIVALNKNDPIQPLFISEELYAAYCKQTGEIRDGHLLVTGVGSIGVPYLVRAGDRFYFKDGNIIWLKNDGKELSGDFLLRLYETDCVQNQLKVMADVGTVATYTIDNAKRTLAVFPKDKDEQQRITSCLNSLDTLITAETHKLEALKAHKKGLMQQLFPSMEAVEA